MSSANRSKSTDWPELAFADWSDTAASLQLWTQVVGKIRLVRSPWTNHSWHVPLYVTARGLGTSLVPYDGRAFTIDFDFLRHELVIQVTDGGERSIALEPRPVAGFYRAVLDALDALRLDVRIHTTPSEIADADPLRSRRRRAPLRPRRRHPLLARARADRPRLQGVPRALHRQVQPRALLLGKLRSRRHALLGSRGTAASGRRAELPRLGGARGVLARGQQRGLLAGRRRGRSRRLLLVRLSRRRRASPSAAVSPAAASYSKALGEFLLPYDEVRTADSPDDVLLEFLQSTYEAAADLAGWDRAALERSFEPVGGA